MTIERAAWTPRASLEVLRQRATALATVRNFFADREVLEVETPLLGSGNVPDEHVSGLVAAPGQGLGTGVHLQTSPELSMKRLVAAYETCCFQICKAFRRDERGSRHHPEFTLLEWYRVGWTHEELIDEVVELIRHVSLHLRPETPAPAVTRHLYRELVHDRTGVDPATAGEAEVVSCARDHGAPEVTRAEALDYLMACVVEPSLEPGRLHVIDRYPADQAALARISTDRNGDETAERFEVYHGPLELANGYGELTDPDAHRKRFAHDRARRRERGLADAGDTEDFFSALESGLPNCSGVALGFDRMLMAILGRTRLDDVLSFR